MKINEHLLIFFEAGFLSSSYTAIRICKWTDNWCFCLVIDRYTLIEVSIFALHRSHLIKHFVYRSLPKCITAVRTMTNCHGTYMNMVGARIKIWLTLNECWRSIKTAKQPNAFKNGNYNDRRKKNTALFDRVVAHSLACSYKIHLNIV